MCLPLSDILRHVLQGLAFEQLGIKLPFYEVKSFNEFLPIGMRNLFDGLLTINVLQEVNEAYMLLGSHPRFTRVR